MPLFTRSKFGIYSLIINEQITSRNYTKLELSYVSTLQIGCQTKYSHTFKSIISFKQACCCIHTYTVYQNSENTTWCNYMLFSTSLPKLYALLLQKSRPLNITISTKSMLNLVKPFCICKIPSYFYFIFFHLS